ncbi:unnamed protein product [Caenorhabditis nigoni]
MTCCCDPTNVSLRSSDDNSSDTDSSDSSITTSSCLPRTSTLEEVQKPFEPGPRTEIRWHNAICCTVIEAMATTMEICMACFGCQGGHC